MAETLMMNRGDCRDGRVYVVGRYGEAKSLFVCTNMKCVTTCLCLEHERLQPRVDDERRQGVDGKNLQFQNEHRSKLQQTAKANVQLRIDLPPPPPRVRAKEKRKKSSTSANSADSTCSNFSFQEFTRRRSSCCLLTSYAPALQSHQRPMSGTTLG